MKNGIGCLLFCFAFCLSCPGKVKPELEVGFTFWEMRLLVENPKPDKSRPTGLTREMVENTVRRKLAEKGIRLVDTAPSGSYLYVNVNQLAASYNVDVRLKKFSEHFGISAEKGVGSVFVPGVQGYYSAVGKFSVPDYNAALRDLERILDSFLFDFLETNLKYEATIEDPQTYTSAWTIRMPLYRRMEDNAQLMEFRCVEFVEELMYGTWRRNPLPR